MGPWLVTQNDEQFSVPSLAELREMAEKGRLSGGDMVQPPGASEWMYAVEIPELEGVLNDTLATDDDDLDYKARGGAGVITIIATVALLAILVSAIGAIVVFTQMVNTDPGAIVGEGGLAENEMLVTADGATLRSGADGTSSVVAPVDKDSRLEMLMKRGDWYRARTPMGQEGWIEVTQVIPAYRLAGGEMERELDPVYNPDDYIFVSNANWLQLDRANTQLTVFRFQLENESQYPMTDLVLLVTIKDGNGAELERLEVAVDGIIPAGERSFVGTLHPDPSGEDPEAAPQLLTAVSFQMLAEDDPDLQLRYSDGVEVEMTAEEFTAASIHILEVRADRPE